MKNHRSVLLIINELSVPGEADDAAVYVEGSVSGKDAVYLLFSSLVTLEMIAYVLYICQGPQMFCECCQRSMCCCLSVVCVEGTERWKHLSSIKLRSLEKPQRCPVSC